MVKMDEPLLPRRKHVPEVGAQSPVNASEPVLATRDHQVIRRWAEARHAEPATGEATSSGPAAANVNDGGSGIRFNFPGTGRFRPITWDEWFDHFDRHELTFVYDNDAADGAKAARFRIVRASDWGPLIG